MMRCNKRRYQVKKETVEEFLARGGKIITYPPSRYEMKMLGYKQIVTNDQIKAFYNTPDWITLRNKVKGKLAPFCPVCGSEEKLVVDHINPIRYFWEQRLDENNLQILCDECNLEKSSMIGWTIDYHIKSKRGLQLRKEQRKAKALKEATKAKALEEERKAKALKEATKAKALEENKKITFGMTWDEKKIFERLWQSYSERCVWKALIPVEKSNFRIYMENTFVGDTWTLASVNKLKKYIKDNFKNIL